jgi:hypothetical protein
MANPTMTLIASNTIGSGGASSVTFSSIPQTGYTDLVVKFSARDNSATTWNNLFVTFNGSSSGYSEKIVAGTNGSAVSASASSTSLTFQYSDGANATSNTFSNGELYIPNYTSSNYKSISTDSVTELNASNNLAGLSAQLWSNSAAITSITFTGGGTIQQYSTFYLYGIASS